MKIATIAITIATLLASSAASAAGAPASHADRAEPSMTGTGYVMPPIAVELYGDGAATGASSLTRAQVLAELARAHQRGELADAERYPHASVEPPAQVASRAQVRAELAAAHRADGLYGESGR